MSHCVLSTQNRFYVGLESEFGQVPAVTADNRIAAVELDIRQRRERAERRDKTGSRTFTGVIPGARKRTEFELTTYLVNNPTPATPPAVGPLVQAGLGAAPLVFTGGAAGSGSTPLQIVFSAPHGLVKGQAFGFNGELRFVESVVNTTTVGVNVPFTATPTAGSQLTAAVSYFPANELPSASVFDYWDPEWAVDRILAGASVDKFSVTVNADFHEMAFRGEAQDVLDTVTFTPGEGELAAFPDEPAATGATEQPVPGNLGQAWLGSPTAQFFSVTAARIAVDNDLDFRRREFGATTPKCTAPGVRRVTADFELFETNTEVTRGLYAAGRNETPVGVMFQLGQAMGQMLGVYLPAVIPQVPEFNDSDRILQWSFSDARAQGTANDEIVVAFG